MNRGVCSRKGRLGKRDAIEVPRGTDGEIALPQRNIEGSPFRIGTAGSPQWPRTSRRSLPASLHFPSSRKGPELVSTSDDPGDSQCICGGSPSGWDAPRHPSPSGPDPPSCPASFGFSCPPCPEPGRCSPSSAPCRQSSTRA